MLTIYRAKNGYFVEIPAAPVATESPTARRAVHVQGVGMVVQETPAQAPLVRAVETVSEVLAFLKSSLSVGLNVLAFPDGGIVVAGVGRNFLAGVCEGDLTVVQLNGTGYLVKRSRIVPATKPQEADDDSDDEIQPWEKKSRQDKIQAAMLKHLHGATTRTEEAFSFVDPQDVINFVAKELST